MSEPILLIEDNALNARLITKILESAGHKVTVYENAEDALSDLHKTQPTLILLDLQLPGMSGYEFASQLRGNIQYRDIRIIAISANVWDVDKQNAYDSGCDGFIEKPINTRTLIKNINLYLEKIK